MLNATATKQKKAAEDAITAKSKVDASNKATLTQPLELPEREQKKTSATEAVSGKMRDSGDGNPTRAEGTSSQIKARNSIAKKQRKTPAIDTVATDG